MIDRLLRREHLSESEATSLLGHLCDPGTADPVRAGVLVALRAKGETADELRGLALAMRSAARAVGPVAGEVLDTCGTGGDGTGSVNLSTAAALVVAAAGLRVAKHGNRAVSSRSGSADVLEAMGIPLTGDPVTAGLRLRRYGFVFLFAPAFHPAMAALADLRRTLGTRTVFNLLGPLTNPARPTLQLIGAADPAAAELLARASVGLVPRAYVVHGADGWDEATPVGPFLRFGVDGDRVIREIVDPMAYGVPRCTADDLRGGDAADNARILARVFAGERSPVRDAVVLNAALALELAGRSAPVPDAIRAIDSGAVARLVEGLRE